MPHKNNVPFALYCFVLFLAALLVNVSEIHSVPLPERLILQGAIQREAIPSKYRIVNRFSDFIVVEVSPRSSSDLKKNQEPARNVCEGFHPQRGITTCEESVPRVLFENSLESELAFSQLRAEWNSLRSRFGINTAHQQVALHSPFVIALLDSGINLNRPNQKDPLWKNPKEIPENGVDDDGNGIIDDFRGGNVFAQNGDVSDCNGHGTRIAEIIHSLTSTGASGYNRVNFKILPIKVTEGCSSTLQSSSTIQGLHYVIDLIQNQKIPIRILNASFGGREFSLLEREALLALERLGVLVVTAAGNGGIDKIGDNNDKLPIFPGSYDIENIVTATSLSPQVNLLNWTDPDEDFSLFPGANFGVKSVDIAVPGALLPAISHSSNTAPLFVSRISGSSYAAGFLSGATAVLMAAKPDTISASVRNAILDGSTPHQALFKKVSSGGYLNLEEALQKTHSSLPCPTFASVEKTSLCFCEELPQGYPLRDSAHCFERTFFERKPPRVRVKIRGSFLRMKAPPFLQAGVRFVLHLQTKRGGEILTTSYEYGSGEKLRVKLPRKLPARLVGYFWVEALENTETRSPKRRVRIQRVHKAS